MATLCDVYVNDAFGTAHRAEATTHGIAKFAPVACAGPLLAAELDALGKALGAPQRPLVAIVAGSKVSTKLTILQSLADKVDNLIVGGGIANTFMKAVGLNIGKSLAEADLVDEAKAIIDKMAARGAPVPIPVDVVCAKEFSPTAAATVKDVGRRGRRRHDPRHRPEDRRPAGRADRQGRHHRLERPGRRVRVRPVRRRHQDAGARPSPQSKAFSIAGGGDTLAAIAKYDIADQIGYISTGGGAFLEFLEGKTLPAVEILLQRSASKAERSPAQLQAALFTCKDNHVPWHQDRRHPRPCFDRLRHSRQDDPRRRRRRAPELLARQGAGPHRPRRAGAPRRRRVRPRSGDHGRHAGSEDPRRQVRRRQDLPEQRRQVHPGRQVGRERRAGQPGTRRPRLQGAAARRASRATSCC